eukprot:m.299260 g.299260  ORF g.299260 m.299260 type:complete len:550 (-) comp14078_c0_seq1:124-1773(-)
MFKRVKHGVAEETRIQIAKEDMASVDSPFNINRLSEIQNSWPIGSQPLIRAGRLYVHEGPLKKMSRKGLKQRQFFLFNDILIYGSIIARGTYANQHVLSLAELAISPKPDNSDVPYGFQIRHNRKSFDVFAASEQDRDVWLEKLRKYIELASGRSAEGDEVVTKAVWIPDNKVSTCMVCQTVEFTLLQRRHHCRKCGKVVCGACSQHKAMGIGKSGKPERICNLCHEDLAGGRAKVTILPPGSVKPGQGNVAAAAAAATGKPVPKPRKPSVDAQDDDSETSDSDDDEEVSRLSEAVKAFVAGDNSAADTAAAASSSANTASGTSMQRKASDAKMHQLTNEQRMALMFMVKDGKLTIEQALAKVTAGETPDGKTRTAPRRPGAPPPRPTMPPAGSGKQEAQPVPAPRPAATKTETPVAAERSAPKAEKRPEPAPRPASPKKDAEAAKEAEKEPEEDRSEPEPEPASTPAPDKPARRRPRFKSDAAEAAPAAKPDPYASGSDNEDEQPAPTSPSIDVAPVEEEPISPSPAEATAGASEGSKRRGRRRQFKE